MFGLLMDLGKSWSCFYSGSNAEYYSWILANGTGTECANDCHDHWSSWKQHVS